MQDHPKPDRVLRETKCTPSDASHRNTQPPCTTNCMSPFGVFVALLTYEPGWEVVRNGRRIGIFRLFHQAFSSSTSSSAAIAITIATVVCLVLVGPAQTRNSRQPAQCLFFTSPPPSSPRFCPKFLLSLDSYACWPSTGPNRTPSGAATPPHSVQLVLTADSRGSGSSLAHLYQIYSLDLHSFTYLIHILVVPSVVDSRKCVNRRVSSSPIIFAAATNKASVLQAKWRW